MHVRCYMLPIHRPSMTGLTEDVLDLRSYQIECVKAMFKAMHDGCEFSLVALPTGAGKTIIFSSFVEEVYKRYSHMRDRIRVTIVAHREKLIGQAYDKLIRVWPDSVDRLGLACASYSKDIDVDSEIIIASIQTITSRLRKGDFEPFDIVLIDEGHRIPARNKPSAYKAFIEYTGNISPKRKVIAFTATPYQLGHGYMYGTACKPGNVNWFENLAYSLPMDHLIEDGYLVPYRIKQAMDIGPELRGVPIVGGEYKNDALGDIMCRFVDTTVYVHKEYGEGRQHCVMFCANITHAIKAAEAFNRSGVRAAAVHSKLSDTEKKDIFERFSSGEIKVLSSVDMLIEGWDETAIDLILMMRPTKSPSIYVQQGGRGLRLHPGKKDLLILDCADNVRNHGFLSDPLVIVPGVGKSGTEAPVKLCPECDFAMHLSASECKECGYVFPKKNYREPGRLTLEEIDRRAVKYTKDEPTLAKIKKVEVVRDLRWTALLLTFTDPLTGKPMHSRYFIHDWKLERKEFLDEWRSLTNLEQAPETPEEVVAMLSSVESWPKAGYFHRENRDGARWPNLCGWHDNAWDGIFPEPDYNASLSIFKGKIKPRMMITGAKN